LGEEDPFSFKGTGGDVDLSVLESLPRGELGDILVTVFSDLDIILERGDLGEVGDDEVGPNRLSIVEIGFSDLDSLFPVDRGEVGGDETAVGIDTVILSAFEDTFGRLVNNMR